MRRGFNRVGRKGEPEGNIGAILEKIMPAVKKAKAKGGARTICSTTPSERMSPFPIRIYEAKAPS
jgi:hypothetical protein